MRLYLIGFSLLSKVLHITDLSKSDYAIENGYVLQGIRYREDMVFLCRKDDAYIPFFSVEVELKTSVSHNVAGSNIHDLVKCFVYGWYLIKIHNLTEITLCFVRQIYMACFQI